MDWICRVKLGVLLPVVGWQQVWVLWSVLGIFKVTTAVGIDQLATGSTVDIPEWTVYDRNGNICMRIAMEAQDSFSLVPIPEEAEVSDSTYCEDDSHSYLELSWSCQGFAVCSIGIDFNVRHGNYTISKIRLQTKTIGEIDWLTARLHYSPTAALGTSMSCIDLDSNIVDFHRLKFQPFARLTNGTYGPDCGCNIVGLPRTGLIIALVIMFVIALFTVFSIVRCYVSPRCQAKRGYSLL